jgi:hypothetical protein
MKKTSLILAISALLCGISSTYVIADEVFPDEGGPLPDGIDLPDGLEPFPVLPTNVSVDSSDPLPVRGDMCEQSYQVTGNVMAEFPVTVTYTNGTGDHTETVPWQDNGGLSGRADGTGWELVQTGDTWYTNKPWILTTDDVTTVKKIVLEPIERETDDDETGDKRLYTFDIGSHIGEVPDDEHTPGAARGRPFQMKTPPVVSEENFKATYSRPVYTMAHGPADGNNVHDDGPTPTHDLYGVLTIEFSPAVGEAELNPAFRFLADTDCILLPVTGAVVSSSSGNVTLFGRGFVYIMETNSVGDSRPLGIPIYVDETLGSNNINIKSSVDEFQLGYCYSFVAISDGGKEEIIPLEIDGKDMKDEGNQYCHK